MASVQPESGRIVSVRSDFRHLSWFQRRLPNLDGLVRVWPNASGLEASRCARIIGPRYGRTQPKRYQFVTFRLGCVLPQTVRIILCKTSLDPIWFWLTVSSFGQKDPVRKQAGVLESSGPVLANASEPIRTGCE